MTDKPSEETSNSSIPDWAVVVLLVEFASLAIALVLPVAPNKTGSSWSFADLFVADPSYLDKVLVTFLVTNGLILVLGLAAWLATRAGRGG